MFVSKQDVQVALAELERERRIREKYYPNAISQRKLSDAEATRRLDAIAKAIKILSTLLREGVVRIAEVKEVSLFER